MKGGHTEKWEVICLQEIANLSGLPGDRVPLREPFVSCEDHNSEPTMVIRHKSTQYLGRRL